MIINNSQGPCSVCGKITQVICDYCEQFVCDEHSDRTYKRRPKDLDLIKCDECCADIGKFLDHQRDYKALKIEELRLANDLKWEWFYKREFGPVQPGLDT